MNKRKPTSLEFRSGFVGFLGRPNVGKSTLLNALIGEPIAVSTRMPQTTRKRIRGILNQPSSQIVFVDTPGVHLRKQALNRFMLGEVKSALEEVDVVVQVIETMGRGWRFDFEPEDRLVRRILQAARRPAFLAINKIDKLEDKSALLDVIQLYHASGQYEEIIPLSAKSGDGIERLVAALESRLPIGPATFPADQFTDQTQRGLATELIREQIILQCGEEIPYSCAVRVESFDEDQPPGMVDIRATIFVETQSQKGILIGKGGQRLKSIGTRARQSIEAMLDQRVFLGLLVKISRDWTRTDKGLAQVGYLDP